MTITRITGRLNGDKGSPRTGPVRLPERACLSMSRYPSVPPPNPPTALSAATASSPGKTTPPRRLLSSKKAAEYLGVSPNTIRKFVSDGKLPAYKIGDKLIKFDPEDLNKYLAAHRADNS